MGKAKVSAIIGVAAAGLLAGAGIAAADGISIADCNTLNLPVQIDFENYPRVVNGTRYDDVQHFNGADIGEHFEGQTLVNYDNFDVLDTFASAPLQLRAGEPGKNLSVEAHGPRQNTLYGLGPVGFEHKNGSGEGAISILFWADQQAFGAVFEMEMAYAGSPPAGEVRLIFFSRDARLLGDIHLTGAGRTKACFQSSGAGIAGVTITNTDAQGISVDDISFDRVLVVG
ncbi:hypothetical protein [Phaeovulum sp.]|uniref:hypothetical protein n=1 Tax=Phaeovulum sp. TaxID=2934796 RepID=UPI003562069E